MKKAIFSLLVIIVMLFSVGCGSGVGASAKAQTAGKQALTAVDEYLDGESSYSETESKLDECYDSLEYVDDLSTGERAPDLFIQADVLDLKTRLLFNQDGDTEDYDNLIESRNSLAEDLGESSR